MHTAEGCTQKLENITALPTVKQYTHGLYNFNTYLYKIYENKVLLSIFMFKQVRICFLLNKLIIYHLQFIQKQSKQETYNKTNTVIDPEIRTIPTA